MAGTLYPIPSDQLTQQRKGMIALSLTDFSAITVSQIALGSRIEIAGAIVGFEANESMGNWALVVAGDVYCYIDSVALTSSYSNTAPTWNTELQGWYDAGATKRCYARLYKTAGGDYTQKAIYTSSRGLLQTHYGLALNTVANGDQEIRFANDARLLWDESEDWLDFDKSIKCKRLTTQYLFGAYTQNQIFDTLDPFIPTVGNRIQISGAVGTVMALFSIAQAYRFNANTIYLYGLRGDSYTIITITIPNGGAISYDVSISW